MIDTISFKIKIDDRAKVEKCIHKDDCRLSKFYQEKVYHKFNYNKELFVSLSLPKYMKRLNIKYLTQKESIRAIEELSKRFGVDVSKAEVVRLDVGFTFHMSHPSEFYIKQILDCKYLDKKTIYKNESITFATKYNEKKVMFYDKLKEILDKEKDSDKRQQILDEYKNKNLLRYEVQLTKEVAKKLKVPKITLDMITEQKFSKKLIEFWAKEYKNVLKKSNTDFGEFNVKGIEELKDALMDIALCDYDYDFIQGLFITPKNASERSSLSRLKKQIKDRLNSMDSKKNKYITQLDKKVDKFVKKYS